MPFVYIIDPFHCNFIKIGKWKTSIIKLQARYQTYYGKNIKVFAYEVENYDELEVIIMEKLSDYKLDPRCELLKKNYLEYYKTVFKCCCKTDYKTCEKKLNTLYLRIKKIPYKIILHQELLKMFNIVCLPSLEGKVIERLELSSFSENIQRMNSIALEGKLFRQQKVLHLWSIRNSLETLRKVLKFFKLTIIQNKRKKVRTKIDGISKNIDISNFTIKTIGEHPFEKEE